MSYAQLKSVLIREASWQSESLGRPFTEVLDGRGKVRSQALRFACAFFFRAVDRDLPLFDAI